MIVGLLLLAASAALLAVGAEAFVENAAGAARRLGLSVLATALLLAGAEPEEMLTASLAAHEGHPGLALGDAVGATLTVLTLALGLAALAGGSLPFGRRVRQYAVAAAASWLLASLALVDGRVGRLEGAGLLLTYIGGVALVWWREREPPTIGEPAEAGGRPSEQARTDQDTTSEAAIDGTVTAEAAAAEAAAAEAAAVEAAAAEAISSTPTEAAGGGVSSPTTSLLLVLGGILLLLLGGNLAVDGATRLARALGQQDGPVGLTLLALATSAEVLALVVAARRHRAGEIAVAGAVGSAAYNATATLGVAALVRPMPAPGMLLPAAAAVAVPLAIVVLSLRRARLGRSAGAALVGGYALFVVLAWAG